MPSTRRFATILTATAVSTALFGAGFAAADGTKDPRYSQPPAKHAPTTTKAGYAGTWTRHGASIVLNSNGSGSVDIADLSGQRNPQSWTTSWVGADPGINITLRTRTKGTGTAAKSGQVLPARLARLDNITYLLVSNWPQRFGAGVREVAFCGPGGEPGTTTTRCGG